MHDYWSHESTRYLFKSRKFMGAGWIHNGRKLLMYLQHTQAWRTRHRV